MPIISRGWLAAEFEMVDVVAGSFISLIIGHVTNSHTGGRRCDPLQLVVESEAKYDERRASVKVAKLLLLEIFTIFFFVYFFFISKLQKEVEKDF